MTIADCENQMDEIKEKRTQLCKTKKVVEAITVLKELNKKHEAEAKKLPLLDESTDSPIFLQVHMKKIPPKKMFKRITVPLPHSMVTDTTEICLFTGDLDKKNKKAEIDPDVLHYKDLLKKQGITKVNEVITLRQLRTEYKVFEAKRQLMAAYDVFLADRKIAQCLPKLLGRGFIQKRKFPIQIPINANLQYHIDTALSKTVFTVTCRGNTCTSEVARLSMEDDKILENVLASVKVVADQLPGEQNNIAGIYIKTAKSLAIPIYINFDNPNEVKIKRPSYNREKVELEELSTHPNAQVKVFRDGRIFVKKTRDTEDSPEEVEKSKPHHGKRKRESDKGVNDDLEGEAAVEIEESESIVADIEEGTNKSMSKKKRKLNEKNKAQEAMESGATELKVEDAEKGTSPKKTRSKKKRKSIVENEAAHEVESIEPEDSIKASPKKGKVKSVVEDIEDTNKSVSKKKPRLSEKNKAQEAMESGLAAAVEEDASSSKTKSGKKSKAIVKNEAIQSVEPEESINAISKKLKVKSKIENTEEDTSVIKKTRLRSRGSVKGNCDLKKNSPKVKNTKKGAKNVQMKGKS